MKVCIQAPQRLIVDALFALVDALGFEPALPDDPGIDVAPIPTPSNLALTEAPVADCARYDTLRVAAHGTR